MAKRIRQRPARNRRFVPGVGVVALVLLAVLDVVLVIAALDHVKPAATDRGSPASARSASPAAGTSSSPMSSDAPVTRAGAPVPEGPLLLAQAPDGTLLRATLGGCVDDSDPQVAVSTDGGATFRTVPVAKGLDGVMSVDARASDDLRLVGADAECSAVVHSGGAGKRIWSAERGDSEWHLVEGGADSVHAPDGVVETPCAPQGLSTLNSVRLLCDSGAILGTADAGETWASLGRLPDATAFAFDGPSRGYALQTRKNCPVAAMTTSDGGASWEFANCLDGETGRAIAVGGDVVTALVDDQVFRSEDGASTWTKVS